MAISRTKLPCVPSEEDVVTLCTVSYGTSMISLSLNPPTSDKTKESHYISKIINNKTNKKDKKNSIRMYY